MINGGGELLGMIGSGYQHYNIGGAALLAQTEQDYLVGREVAVGTNATVSSGSGLIGSHCYFVDSISGRSSQQLTVTLRNLWGGSNEFITVSASDFEASFGCEASAYV
jgi:hypothetical protein